MTSAHIVPSQRSGPAVGSAGAQNRHIWVQSPIWPAP